MTALEFQITFHTQFRVTTGYSADGVHAAVDRDEPLPGDHLKGLMRAAASRVLLIRDDLVEAVFGSAAYPSPWSWTAAVPQPAADATAAGGGGWSYGQRHRVSIDPRTHTALTDHLVQGDYAWTPTATFTIDRTGPLTSDTSEREQILVLRCAAAAVHGLGSWRRRGWGWVTISPTDRALTDTDIADLLRLRQGQPSWPS